MTASKNVISPLYPHQHMFSIYKSLFNKRTNIKCFRDLLTFFIDAFSYSLHLQSLATLMNRPQVAETEKYLKNTENFELLYF